MRIAPPPPPRTEPHLKPHKLRKHQKTALKNVLKGFQTASRGKLIMACGTGKTLIAIRLTEELVPKNGTILFLVPSIALLSQTLMEWGNHIKDPYNFNPIAICSDTKVGHNDDYTPATIPIPVTTDANRLIQALSPDRRNIIISTYHSLGVIAEAQLQGMPKIDLTICDEAHRTTGAEQRGKEKSAFLMVHDEEKIQSHKRLYMTATPRIYKKRAKEQAQEHDIELCSMDDEGIYGTEFHRLDFGEAVKPKKEDEEPLLADYKVLILTVSEDTAAAVAAAMNRRSLGKDEDLNIEDVGRIIGCWNALAKRITNAAETGTDTSAPMQRAVAFCSLIKDSKKVTAQFTEAIEKFISLRSTDEKNREDSFLDCEIKHTDGTEHSLTRDQKLDWLREYIEPNHCRILSNVRVLTEGVDVPALDAVLFMSPRKSQIDIVQAVGRVMRKTPGKKEGYIILPIVISADQDPNEALDRNEKYDVIWQVLQALRSHDERFNAEINRLQFNEGLNKPGSIIDIISADEKPIDIQLKFPFEEWRKAIYAKIVEKCGDRFYWKNWAKNIAQMAESISARIHHSIKNDKSAQVFDRFHQALQENINPTISPEDAITMLAQHIISQPIFDVLFAHYDFAKYNPVSQAMNRVLHHLHRENIATETKKLEPFYKQVKRHIEGIDNAQGRQHIIKRLYEDFFKELDDKQQESLGIVYTPIEIVDFILQSTDYALQKHLNCRLTAENVNVLDPFTGTGAFIVRLLQSSLIKEGDLEHKYNKELHANECLLLAYYIAAINIEEAYHSRKKEYQPFKGIAFTDTFQSWEDHKNDQQTMYKEFLSENSDRITKQLQTPIKVILGNPPYFTGQKSANDNNAKLSYPCLEERIRTTYAEESSATLKKGLYDSYVRAIRWASDRIEEHGIIAFVSNGSYIDVKAMDGLRHCLAQEFSYIYVFNLRGDIRKRDPREGGNIFGQSSQLLIAISLFIKDPAHQGACQIHYHDIGDKLSTEEKLDKIQEYGSIENISWQNITPNEHHDWINQRRPEFKHFLPLGDPNNKKKGSSVPALFTLYSLGIGSGRDPWVYNFSPHRVAENMSRMINTYNQERKRYHKQYPNKKDRSLLRNLVTKDPKQISWHGTLENEIFRNQPGIFSVDKIRPALYRPFTKQYLYFDKQFNASRYQQHRFFPQSISKNKVILVSHLGPFSLFMTDHTPDLEICRASQCFPRWTYATSLHDSSSLQLERLDNIPPATQEMFRQHYKDKNIDGDTLFYFAYGLLHSPSYQEIYANNLAKELPRIPYPNAKDFWAFYEAGKRLGDIHIDYEHQPPYPVDIQGELIDNDPSFYRVEKMRFDKKDKTVLHYNDHITLINIPIEAHDYRVNNKSPLEWIVKSYENKIDKKQKTYIRNDPNDWSDDPRYILNLIRSLITLSLESAKIIKSLPEIKLPTPD